MRLREIITESLSSANAEKIINSFLKFAKSQLDLDQLPKINTIGNMQYSVELRSFGGYDPNTKQINIMTSNRHIQDLLRTLAHELVHYKQDLNNELDSNSGQDGSPQENQANAEAAVIMRKWAKLHPEMFSYSALE